MADLGSTVGAAVAQATAAASQAANEAARAVGEAMRGIDISGIGTKLSEESIKIVGSGSVSGNPVKTVEFQSAGSARVHGPLVAEVVRVAGSCMFEGDVTVEGEFRSAGSQRIAGSLKAESVAASGSLEVQGPIEAEEISSSGSLHVRGPVKAERIRSGGRLQVEGDVRTEEFRSGGSVRIEGGLKAEDITIDLGGSSRIPTIKGERIQVKATGGFFRVRGDLSADQIEGEEVELEATVAALVKGEDVTIGPHCRIDVVEAEDLVVHQSSEVRERRTPS